MLSEFKFPLLDFPKTSHTKLNLEVNNTILTQSPHRHGQGGKIAQVLIKNLVDRSVYFGASLHCHLKEMIITC